MKKTILSLLLPFAMLGFSSCTDDIDSPDIQQSESGGLTLRYEVDPQMPLSRGITATGIETRLNQIHILFFDPEDGDRFVTFATKKVSGGGSFSLEPPALLEENHPYRVLAIGNGDMYAPGGETMDEYLEALRGSYQTVKGSLRVMRQGQITADNVTALPLYGMFVDEKGCELTFTYFKEGDKFNVKEDGTFSLSRAICRFDLHNLASGRLDIRYIRLINSPEGSYLFTDGFVGGKIPEFEDADFATADYNAIDPADDGAVQYCEALMYGFPNVVQGSKINDNVTTAFMIAGYYTDPVTGVADTDLTFYRFNISNLGELQSLNRNYCYRGIIKSVLKRGSDNPVDAYNNSGAVFEYDVEEQWETGDTNVVADAEGNFLIASSTRINLEGERGSAAEFKIKASAGLDWAFEPSERPGNENDLFSFDKTAKGTIRCTALHDNDTDYLRYAYVDVVGTNRVTGTQIRLPLMVLQLSRVNYVKYLMVDNRVGTFPLELENIGGVAELTVKTGATAYKWSATVTPTEGAWGTELTCTEHGDNRGTLTINYPKNATLKTRKAVVTVSFDDNELNEDGSKKVPDVEIELVQHSVDLLTVKGFTPGETQIYECFSPDANNKGYPVNVYTFVPSLADSKNYRIRVMCDLNNERDMNVRTSSGTGYPNYPNTRWDASGSYSLEAVCPSDIQNITSGTTVYLMPYRMGPNDPDIHGTVTVRAYPIKTADFAGLTDEEFNAIECPELSFNVILRSEECVMDDVIYKYNNKYILFTDRMLGAPSKLEVPEAKYYTAMVQNSKPYMFITDESAPDGYVTLNDNVEFAGGYLKYLYTYAFDAFYYPDGTSVPITGRDDMIAEFKHHTEPYGGLYTYLEQWSLPKSTDLDQMRNYTSCSKGRLFVTSPYRTKDGKRICTWISCPGGYKTNNLMSSDGCLDKRYTDSDHRNDLSYFYKNDCRLDLYWDKPWGGQTIDWGYKYHYPLRFVGYFSADDIEAIRIAEETYNITLD